MINFENCPVAVNQLDFDDVVDLFASSVSISQELPSETLPHLGQQGLSGAYPTEPPNGTVSVDFYISGAAEISSFLGLKKFSYQVHEGDFIDISVGPYSVDEAVLTSYSINASPNELITANASFDYYGPLVVGSTVAQVPKTGKLAHGNLSTGTFAESLGFSTAPFSFNYSLNQSFQILRTVGDYEVDVALWEGGNETVSVEGYDLPTGLVDTTRSTTSSQWFFPKTGSLEFALKNICGNQYALIGITGTLAARDVSVSQDNVVNGSIELTAEL